jgi:hypothetical protein
VFIVSASVVRTNTFYRFLRLCSLRNRYGTRTGRIGNKFGWVKLSKFDEKNILGHESASDRFGRVGSDFKSNIINFFGSQIISDRVVGSHELRIFWDSDHSGHMILKGGCRILIRGINNRIMIIYRVQIH